MTMKTENQVINKLVTGILVLENGQVFYEYDGSNLFYKEGY